MIETPPPPDDPTYGRGKKDFDDDLIDGEDQNRTFFPTDVPYSVEPHQYIQKEQLKSDVS